MSSKIKEVINGLFLLFSVNKGEITRPVKNMLLISLNCCSLPKSQEVKSINMTFSKWEQTLAQLIFHL